MDECNARFSACESEFPFVSITLVFQTQKLSFLANHPAMFAEVLDLQPRGGFIKELLHESKQTLFSHFGRHWWSSSLAKSRGLYIC